MAFWKKECNIDSGAVWEEIVLWKIDLRGAYTLLSFDPRDEHLFGMELSDDFFIFLPSRSFQGRFYSSRVHY